MPLVSCLSTIFTHACAHVLHGGTNRLVRFHLRFVTCYGTNKWSTKYPYLTIKNNFPGLLSALFRGTDLVPSDVMAGCILLRIRQKRETHELRRLNLLTLPTYTTGIHIIYLNTFAKTCDTAILSVTKLSRTARSDSFPYLKIYARLQSLKQGTVIYIIQLTLARYATNPSCSSARIYVSPYVGSMERKSSIFLISRFPSTVYMQHSCGKKNTIFYNWRYNCQC